jgi:hypothetical protein
LPIADVEPKRHISRPHALRVHAFLTKKRAKAEINYRPLRYCDLSILPNMIEILVKMKATPCHWHQVNEFEGAATKVITRERIPAPCGVPSLVSDYGSSRKHRSKPADYKAAR